MKLSLPNAVTSRFSRQILVAQKNSPQILFVSGLALMGATVVTACKGTLQLEDTLDHIRADRDDVDRVARAKPEKYSEKEVSRLHLYIQAKGVVSIVKLYLPAMTLGVAAVACLTKSHNTLTRRNAGLSAALAATDRALKSYRERVVAELGEDKDREFMYGKDVVEQEYLDGNGKVKTKKVAVAAGESQYSRYWGKDTSTEWSPHSDYNVAKLRSVQEWATMMLNHRGHLFLNEVFRELGLSDTPAGAVCGWQSRKYGGRDGFVDFGVLVPGEEVAFIDFMQGHAEHILLDFNVDGEIWRNI